MAEWREWLARAKEFILRLLRGNRARIEDALDYELARFLQGRFAEFEREHPGFAATQIYRETKGWILGYTDEAVDALVDRILGPD